MIELVKIYKIKIKSMENNDIKNKASETETLTKDNIFTILEKIEGKNFFSIFLTIINEGHKISSSFNSFVNSINFDNKLESNNEYGILYDLFGEDKKIKKRKKIDNLFNSNKSIKWIKQTFKEGILKDYPDLFSFNDIEKTITIFNYYKSKDKDKKLEKLILNKSGEIDLTNEEIKKIKEKYKAEKELKNIINLNLAGENTSRDERKTYFDKINEISSIKVEKDKINDLLKDENIIKLLKNEEIKNIVDEYIEYKINNEKDNIKKSSLNYFDNILKEVEGKKVILEYIKIKDFIVSIYSSTFLSIFSGFIIRKIIKNLDNNFIDTNNYRILKYVVIYIVSKNDMEGYYTQKFFKEFEDEYKNFNKKFEERNKLIKSENKEKIYNFVKSKKVISILSFCFGILLTLSYIYGVNISNYIKSSVNDTNLLNKKEIILISNDNLYFSGITLEVGNDGYLWNMTNNIFDKYLKEKGINFSQNRKNELNDNITKKYLLEKNAEKLPIGFKIDMGKLEKIFQEEIIK
ncbi:hypothetical protein H3C61_00555 [Candidatus Gracilibacteria bacterium]|nr:hypothetical protein [Candidatus Gracilibacteria bacterium]